MTPAQTLALTTACCKGLQVTLVGTNWRRFGKGVVNLFYGFCLLMFLTKFFTSLIIQMFSFVRLGGLRISDEIRRRKNIAYDWTLEKSEKWRIWSTTKFVYCDLYCIMTDGFRKKLFDIFPQCMSQVRVDMTQVPSSVFLRAIRKGLTLR